MAKAICFVEYRISAQYEQHYRNWMDDKRKTMPAGFMLYEGTDQPLLFVEVWEGEDAEAAGKLKEERCSERSSWSTIAPWVEGGASKVHAWTFVPVSLRY